MTKLVKVKKQEGDQEVEVEEPETHKGGLFFPLPNGTALLYRLVGTATEPDAEGELRETVTAKKAKSIIIPVKNWSKLSQRFHASWMACCNTHRQTMLPTVPFVERTLLSASPFATFHLAT